MRQIGACEINPLIRGKAENKTRRSPNAYRPESHQHSLSQLSSLTLDIPNFGLGGSRLRGGERANKTKKLAVSKSCKSSEVSM